MIASYRVRGLVAAPQLITAVLSSRNEIKNRGSLDAHHAAKGCKRKKKKKMNRPVGKARILS